MNPDRLRQRAAITAAVRQWFEDHGYLEVHTSVIVSAPCLEEHLEPVQVGEAFLHTSPEFAMKRVLASGLCRVYQVVPCFREEEVGQHHQREFTMLEWYRVNAGTRDLMTETESLIAAAAEAVGVPRPRFVRRSVNSLWEDAGIQQPQHEEAWFRGWVTDIEPGISEPTIVFDYPSWQAALARERRGTSDRFEVYFGGIEIGNCFAEECDPRVLRERFATSARKREVMGKTPHPVDEALIASTLKMPRAAGMAIGLDRLVMALTGAAHIREVQAR